MEAERKLEDYKERQKRLRVINLMLITYGEKKHYCWIKNMSRLLSSQESKHNGAIHICYNCMNLRRTKEALMYHQRWCLENKQVALRFPKLTEKIRFKNYNHSMRVPFIIYADFGSYLKRVHSCDPRSDKSYTEVKQHHKPMGFSFRVVSSLGEEHEKKIYIAKNDDEVENGCL